MAEAMNWASDGHPLPAQNQAMSPSTVDSGAAVRQSDRRSPEMRFSLLRLAVEPMRQGSPNLQFAHSTRWRQNLAVARQGSGRRESCRDLDESGTGKSLGGVPNLRRSLEVRFRDAVKQPNETHCGEVRGLAACLWNSACCHAS